MAALSRAVYDVGMVDYPMSNDFVIDPRFLLRQRLHELFLAVGFDSREAYVRASECVHRLFNESDEFDK